MELIFMGTGAAEGIPRIMCKCDHCREVRDIASQIEKGALLRKKDRLIIRKRSSILIKSGDLNILLDTPPEIHQFFGDYAIDNIFAIFLSHKHFDHIWGFRDFEFWDGNLINIYTISSVIPLVRGFVGLKRDENNERFLFHKVYSRQTIDLGSLKVTPFRLNHKVPTLGFLFEEKGKKLIHLSDSSWELSKWHIKRMEEADVVVLHTTSFDKPVSDHMSVKDVLELNQRYKFKKIILSHLSHHNLPHDSLVKELSNISNIVVAYDGMRVSI